MKFNNRMQKFRDNLKKDPKRHREHLEKERHRDKKRRQAKKLNMDAVSLEERRKKDRERQRKCQQRKKQKNLERICMTATLSIGSYKCERALKKAVSKVKRSLPQSPSKRTAVLSEIAAEVLPVEISKKLRSNRKPHCGISDAVIKYVKEFYERDDIVRQCPGIKEWKSIKDKRSGKRIRVQKKYLTMSLRECYVQFKIEYPETKIGKSIFYSLRPKHVSLVREIPHDVCMCIYHENFKYLVEAVHNSFSFLPRNCKDFLKLLTCDLENEVCMTNKCLRCESSIKEIAPLKCDKTAFICWKQWVESNGGSFEIKFHNGDMQDIVNSMDSQLLKFKTHFYVKNVQSAYFRNKKENIPYSEAVLQIDFAENFAIVAQNEIQSAHWRHKQATVFTACSWIRNDEKTKSFSYVVISDDLTHSKYCVWLFIRSILKDLVQRNPHLKIVHIFSDGCAAQFKNRYNLSNICTAKADFGIQISWSFFPTSHGKGAVDGIGATVKRAMWTAVKADKIILNKPVDCYSYLVNAKLNGIVVFYVPQTDINNCTKHLEKRWKNLPLIKNLRSMHYFEIKEPASIHGGLTAQSPLQVIFTTKGNKLLYTDVYSDTEDES